MLSCKNCHPLQPPLPARGREVRGREREEGGGRRGWGGGGKSEEEGKGRRGRTYIGNTCMIYDR